MRTLYAGPWVGEFGWQLCSWNPIVRHISHQYDHTTIIAPETSRYLYEFADEFISIKTGGNQSFYQGEIFGELPRVKTNSHLDPQKIFKKRNKYDLEWRNLSNNKKITPIDIMCAFRPKKYYKGQLVQGKEYPKNLCQELISKLLDKGYSIGCYGGLENYWFDGCMDLRGQSLEDQCAFLSKANCAIGPSSGTIHLASLCKCPHITWLGCPHATLKNRYEKVWNPFNTQVKFMGYRPPSVATILDSLLDMINNA